MKKTYDLTRGNPGKVLLLFAVPILMGNLLQQLYSTVDSIVVGHFVGAHALGAVGTTFPIVFMVTAVAFGLSSGVSVMVGQSVGSGGQGVLPKIISVALGVTVVLSLVLVAVCSFFAPALLGLIRVPQALYANALIYLRVYFLGLVFTFAYNVASAVFRALGDSKTPLIFLAVACIANIVLDILFVAGFNMGVFGVAVATVFAQGLSFLLQMVMLSKRMKLFKEAAAANPPPAGYEKVVLGKLLHLTLPTTLQEVLIGFGMFVMQALVNGFGPNAAAAYTACAKVENFAMRPMINTSIALTAFSAQNIGAKKPQRIVTGYKYAILATTVLAGLAAAAALLLPRALLGIFLSSQQTAQEVFAVGQNCLAIAAVSFFFMALTFTAEGVLKGAGDVKVFALFSTLGMVAKLAAAFGLMPLLGVNGLFIAGALGWGAEGFLATARLLRGKWKNLQPAGATAAALKKDNAIST